MSVLDCVLEGRRVSSEDWILEGQRVEARYAGAALETADVKPKPWWLLLSRAASSALFVLLAEQSGSEPEE